MNLIYESPACIDCTNCQTCDSCRFTYDSWHRHLKKALGTPAECITCDGWSPSGRNTWALHPSLHVQYKSVFVCSFDAYMPMCRPCHLSQDMKNRQFTDEHREAISRALIGRMKGVPLSNEHREAISVWWTDDRRRERSERMTGVPLPQSTRGAISQARAGVPLSDEHREALLHAWDKVGADERSERARKTVETLGAEGRKARAQAIWKTRRARYGPSGRKMKEAE